jgi:hypothetical protein
VVGAERRLLVRMELSGFGGGNKHMQDILWVAVTIAFFMLSIAYVRFCDGVK